MRTAGGIQEANRADETTGDDGKSEEKALRPRLEDEDDSRKTGTRQENRV